MDETAKTEIFKLVSDIAWNIDAEVLSLFMAKIDEMDPSTVRERDLDFLYNLSSKMYQNPKPKEAALEVFWHIAIGEKRGYIKEIWDPARKHLIDLTKTSDRSIKD